jgi:hypothetical protein
MVQLDLLSHQAGVVTNELGFRLTRRRELATTLQIIPRRSYAIHNPVLAR